MIIYTHHFGIVDLIDFLTLMSSNKRRKTNPTEYGTSFSFPMIRAKRVLNVSTYYRRYGCDKKNGPQRTLDLQYNDIN